MSESTRSVPHASWAELYDEIYEETFGTFYAQLSAVTLHAINALVPPRASIVDFGAGTGRLSIPLAAAGHQITAVEPSAEMLKVLSRKASAAGVSLRTLRSRMADHAADASADLATSVFTVIAYVLDEAELVRSFRAAAQALKPGGLLLLDVPRRGIFASGASTTCRVQRRVTVTPEMDGIFLYEEDTRVKRGDEWLVARDAFRIRCWTPEAVRSALAEAGFTLACDLSEEFAFTGAQYWCYRRSPRSRA